MSAYESTGKTVEEAINAGLEKLNLSIAEVQVDILDEGSKGLFGLFGSKMARVRLTVKEDEEGDTSDLFAGSLQDYGRARPKAEKPAAKPVEKAAEKPAEKPERRQQPARAPKAPKAEVEAQPKAAQADQADEPAKPSRPPRKRKPKDKPAAEAQAPSAPPPPAVQLDPATLEGKVQTFLQEVTRLMDVAVSVEVHSDEEGNIRATMAGDTLGILIGRRGETLDALQYLTGLHLNRGLENYTRVTLDSEGYRAKREDALIRLANRMASRAVKTGRRVSLEPMNPYERRILHSALQNHPGITTHSEGEEPNRHVVITLAKDAPRGQDDEA